MDSPPSPSPPALGGGESAAGGAGNDTGALSQVDPFLVEALENPRHRLTILRMEIDIQRFMQSPDQYQFEFQHFPSSYLRRAAHRVAQYYGLQTMVLDNILDGKGRIIVRKTPESRHLVVRLSDVPAKQLEHEKPGHVKIVIRPRPITASLNDVSEREIKQNSLRTVEEREEEYDKARARIFCGSNSPEVGASSQAAADGGSLYLSRVENEDTRKIMEEPDKCAMKDGSFRVAIFKDREKDRNDPDYDRSYDRYFRGTAPDQNVSLGLYHVHQPSHLQHESGFPQLRQMPMTQAAAGYKPSNHIMSSYYTGCNQTSRDAVYVPWTSPAMMYAHSYEHFRNGVFQVPFYQEPLSFEHHHKC